MIGQLIINGFVTGLLIALPALALTLVYGILKFPNFAVGAMLTLGGYAAWVANVPLGLPLPFAAVIAALTAAAVSVLADALVFARLREAGTIALMVASMGVSLVVENVCRFAFGNAPRDFNVPIARSLRWHGMHINHEQIQTAWIVGLSLVLVHLLLNHGRLGRAMRAVADNPSLAAVRGIERQRIVRLTWAIAGALTAVSGVLAGLDRAVDPLLGWDYQIPIFAAAILGGLGNPGGAVAGALLIGVAEELSTIVLPTQYRQVVGFVVILVLLLVRARGLFGAKAVRQ